MKKLFAFPLLALLFSCTNSIYHVASVHSEQVKRIDRDFAVENEHLKVMYNLWEEGGRMRFMLFNKTDQPLYIDWSKSVLLRNDSITPYTHLPKRAVADTTVRYFYQNLLAEPFRRTARGNQFTEVPPQMFVAIADFPIQQPVLHKKTKANLFTYTKQNSSLRVGQQLSYSFDTTGLNAHRIEHSFWVDTIQVMRRDELTKLYGSWQTGQPNALYAVDKQVDVGRTLVITVGITVGVTAGVMAIVLASAERSLNSFASVFLRWHF